MSTSLAEQKCSGRSIPDNLSVYERNGSDAAGEQRPPGKMWGDFWPEEHVPEWDDVEFAPRDVTGKTGDFVVYSNHGLILGRVKRRCKAMSALRHWRDAAYVTLGNQVIARRIDSTVRAGQAAEDAYAETAGVA